MKVCWEWYILCIGIKLNKILCCWHLVFKYNLENLLSALSLLARSLNLISFLTIIIIIVNIHYNNNGFIKLRK